MNMKTTKFLAVLAVLAMAFAAFAVVVPSEEQEATATGNMPVQTDVTAADIAAITIGADGKGTTATSGYVDLSKSTVDNEITYSGTAAAAIYIIPGEKNVTIKSTGNNTNNLTIYIAKEVPSSGSGKVTYYCNLGVALKMTSLTTDSATLTLSFDSTKGPSAKVTGLTGFTVDTASAYGALHFVDNTDATKDVYNLYAQGTTVSGTISLSYTATGTLADSVNVRNATVSVSQKIGTTTNKISFTGLVDTDGGLTIIAGETVSKINGCAVEADNAAITVDSGSFTVDTTAINWTADKFNFNALASNYNYTNGIEAGSILYASGHEFTNSIVVAFGKVSATVVGLNADKSLYAMNMTGTITVKNTSGKEASMALTGASILATFSGTTDGVLFVKNSSKGVLDLNTGSFELIKGTFTLNDGITKTVPYGETLQVDSGATLELADGATLQVTGSMYVAGEVKGTTIAGANIKVLNSTDAKQTDKAVFKMRSEGTLTYIAFTTDSNGVIDLDAAMKTVEIGGILESDTNLTYGPTQKVYITSDLTITKGITVTIRGELEIPAGTKIIIEKGSRLVIDGITADADIFGGVLIEKGDFTITNSKAVNVYGGIESREDGTLAPASNLTFKTGSYSDLSGAFTITGEKTKVDAGAILSINGNFSGKLKNAGNVVLDGAKITADNTTITMTATDAIVDIEKVTVETANHKLIITDNGIKVTVSGKEGTAANANSIEITSATALYGISGLEIKEKATGTYKSGTTTVTNKMYLSGAVEKVIATGTITETPTSVVNLKGYVADAKNGFVISDELDIGKKVEFLMTAAVSISGDLVIGDGAELKDVATVGKITVSGSISMYADQTASIQKVLNGVAFKADTNEYVITTLTHAAAFVATCEGNVTVKVYGTNYVTEETYITKNMRVSNGDNAPSITVGSATLNTVKMTVISGASVATDITVYGILTAEVAKNITGKVTADVKVTDGESATWTSLANALATAEPGDVIEITNPTLEIASNMTIPELVTVYIPDGTTASITKKKILTVDGILLADAKVNLGEDAKLVVNGVARFIEASVEAAYTAYGSDAAYYMNDGYAYITNFAYAATDDAKDVYIFGTVKESESCVAEAKAIHIGNADVAGVLSVSDLGLVDGAYVMVGTNAKSELNGIISGVNDDEEIVGTVALSEYKGLVSCTYNIADDYYTFGINAITGTVTITEGIVTLLNDVANATTLNVAADAILMIPKGIDLTLSKGVLAGLVTVQGTLTINDEDVDLLGSIIVAYDKDESIKGVLTVSDITMEAGSIVVVDGAEFDVTGDLTIGNPATSLNAAPVIIGAVTLGPNNFMIVYADADVDEMVINPNSDGESTAKTTTFFINDMEYMTIYASATTNVKYNDVLKDLKFQIEELEPTQLAELDDASAWGLTNATIGTDLLAYAELDYAKVTIQASWVKGLSLYVDGVRISTPGALKLPVGVHLVSVTVDAGYACDNIGITFNGVAVTPAGIFVEVDDTGSVLAVTGDVYIPEPEPVTPEEKSEWTITTILLVVLVILIAIMAVIVALRLNRS